MRLFLIATWKTGIRRGRRARRGVSLFAVVLGLFVVVMVAEQVVQAQLRQQKTDAGKELAGIAAVLSNRWEQIIHRCAIEAAQSGTACSDFGFFAAEWAVLNSGLFVGGVPIITDIPASLRMTGSEPISWSGRNPIVVTKDLSAELFIASVAQAPVATGLIVFRPEVDLHPLTLAAFRAGMEDWNEVVAEADEISPAEEVCVFVVGCTIGANDVAVMTFPFVTIESDWLLREPWVGRSFAHEMQADVALLPVTDASTGGLRGAAIAAAETVASTSGIVQVSTMTSNGATLGSVLVDDQDARSFSRSRTSVLRAGNVAGQGRGHIRGSLRGETISTGGHIDAHALVITDTGETSDTSSAETLLAQDLTLSGALNAGEFVFETKLSAAALRVNGVLFADRFDIAGTARSARLLANRLYGSQLTLGSLSTSGCSGC